MTPASQQEPPSTLLPRLSFTCADPCRPLFPTAKRRFCPQTPRGPASAQEASPCGQCGPGPALRCRRGGPSGCAPPCPRPRRSCGPTVTTPPPATGRVPSVRRMTRETASSQKQVYFHHTFNSPHPLSPTYPSGSSASLHQPSSLLHPHSAIHTQNNCLPTVNPPNIPSPAPSPSPLCAQVVSVLTLLRPRTVSLPRLLCP